MSNRRECESLTARAGWRWPEQRPSSITRPSRAHPSGNARQLATMLACWAIAGYVQSAGVNSTATTDQPRSLPERLRVRGDGEGAAGITANHTEARERERVALLAQGESALADDKVETALGAFDRAASMRHAADSEMALVRAYMQGGHYRRALAFAAHTAGVHTNAPGASALYAWLLLLGGQRAAAQRSLDGDGTRAPGDPGIVFVRAALHANARHTEDLPLVPPLRLAPYGSASGLPPKARVIGSGTLIDDGRRVLIPAATLPTGTEVWMRNGLGKLRRGRVERRLLSLSVALVRLEGQLPFPDDMTLAPRDPFPGSIVYAVEFAVARDATPGWPMLHTGFAGRPLEDGQWRALGIALPEGPRGGPVFDAEGRLAGVAVPGRRGQDRLLLPSQLTGPPAGLLPPPKPLADGRRLGIDEIYERSLRVSVQVLGVR